MDSSPDVTIPAPCDSHQTPLRLLPEARAVLVDGQPIELSATEYAILQHLLENPAQTFTRREILDAIHADQRYSITDRAVDVQITGLRKKLGRFASCVETVRGKGYRLQQGIREAAAPH